MCNPPPVSRAAAEVGNLIRGNSWEIGIFMSRGLGFSLFNFQDPARPGPGPTALAKSQARVMNVAAETSTGGRQHRDGEPQLGHGALDGSRWLPSVTPNKVKERHIARGGDASTLRRLGCTSDPGAMEPRAGRGFQGHSGAGVPVGPSTSLVP